MNVYQVKEAISEVKYSSPEIIIKEMSIESRMDQEALWLLCLNAKNYLTHKHLIGLGGLTYANVDMAILFKRALISDASSIIVVHNHPSGECEPSKEDIDLTRKIKECGKMLNISLLDHIILGKDNQYYSFVEKHIYF